MQHSISAFYYLTGFYLISLSHSNLKSITLIVREPSHYLIGTVTRTRTLILALRHMPTLNHADPTPPPISNTMFNL